MISVRMDNIIFIKYVNTWCHSAIYMYTYDTVMFIYVHTNNYIHICAHIMMMSLCKHMTWRTHVYTHDALYTQYHSVPICTPLITSQFEMSTFHINIKVSDHWWHHRGLRHHSWTASVSRRVECHHSHWERAPSQEVQQSRRPSWSAASCRCCQRWGCL